MRMWVGTEMEGPKTGLNTLFIETEHLNEEEVDIVLFAINDHEPLALYLGAGRVDTVYNAQALRFLLGAVHLGKVTVTIETSDLSTITPFVELLLMYNVQVVHRTMVPEVIGIRGLVDNLLYTKIDDGKTVMISNFMCQYSTPLDTLKDGLFIGTDEMIFDDTKN